MSEWKKVKLGEITESCLGKMLDAAKNRGEYKPYLANLNVRWGSFDTDNLSLMKFEEDEDERYGIKYGDLIICEGGEPGRCAIWKEQMPDMKIQKALHRVRPKKGLVDNFYLFYWFLLAGKCNWIDQYCTGATIKHLPGQKLKEVVVDLPPLATQHSIATILSRYDSLIENYQKQIKLLEEAAQRLYKEWFVDLHFPGHENTKIVDGMPKGWEKKKLADVCDTIGGGTPSTKVVSYYEGGTISWVTPTDITKNNSLCLLSTEKKITHEGLNHSSAKMLPKEAILMTSRASVGFFGICDFEVCTNQGFISCVPFEKDFQMYLLCNLINRVEEIRIKAGGSTYLEISKSVFRNFDIICPAQSVIKDFQGKAHSLLERTRIIAKQIRLLTEARDRLLPKLMSGEIEVGKE